jgi:hypothetical protein
VRRLYNHPRANIMSTIIDREVTICMHNVVEASNTLGNNKGNRVPFQIQCTEPRLLSAEGSRFVPENAFCPKRN